MSRVLHWTLAGLIALLGIDWARVAYAALHDGNRALPVSVRITPPTKGIGVPTESWLSAVHVYRVSPRGNVDEIDRIPGSVEWMSGRAWFGALRIELPNEHLHALGALEVALGERAFAYSADRVTETWGVSRTTDGRVQLNSPPSLSMPRPSLGPLVGVINWPSDARMLGAVLFDGHLARIALLLLLLLAGARARRIPDFATACGAHMRRLAIVAVVTYGALGVLPTIASRVAFSLDVEQLEGVQAVGTWAFMQGHGLFQLPGPDYAGNIYTPGYHLASAAWASLFGLSMPSLRALTLMLIAITAACAASIARQLTGRARDGLLWLPIYLLMFDYYGWVDNANKDALHTALAMAGFAVLASALQGGIGRRADVACAVAGVIWALAFMTKQSHVTAVITTLLVLLLIARRQFWITAVSFGFVCAASTALCVWTWGREYWLWTFEIPRAHGFSVLGASIGLFSVLPVAAGHFVIAGGLLTSAEVARDSPWSPESRRVRWVFLAFLLGTFITGCMSVGKARGGPYALMPGFAVIAVLVSIALMRPSSPRSAFAFPLLLMAMTNPFDRWVSARDHRAGDALVARVAAETGEVWVPYHPWVNVVAGKHPHAPLFCIGEWIASGRPFPTEVLAALERRRFALVVTDFNLPDHPRLDASQEPLRTLALHYRPDPPIALQDAFIQEDGWTNVPRVLWRPKP